jgi:tetratricopeptide (TPR) repeat protein
MNRYGMLGFTLAVAVACGAAQPSTKKEVTKLAADTPPPPSVTPGAVVERKVTNEAKSDFAGAVKYFQDAAKDGWTNDECTSAAKKFMDVASEHDKMVEAYYNAGVSYQMCNDMTHAREQYEKALKINPSHAPSLANIGEIVLRGNDTEKAKSYFEAAVKADAQITAARNNLAWLLYEKLRLTDARKDDDGFKKIETEALGHLQRVLAVDNDNVVAYTIMALIFMEGSEKNKNRLDVANLLLERGKEKKEDYAPLHNAKGLLALRKADIAKALKGFERAAELDKKMLEPRINLAQIVLSFRKYDDAEKYFREVLALNPAPETKYDATVGLGVALRGQGSVLRSKGDLTGGDAKIAEAEKQYKAAIALDGKRGDAYFNMGLLWNDYKTNNDKLEKNKEAYLQAKKYFQDFVSKNDGTADTLAEAKDRIEDCDKYVKILDQAIAAQNAPPPAPTPAPTPPPAPAPAPGPTAGKP